MTPAGAALVRADIRAILADAARGFGLTLGAGQLDQLAHYAELVLKWQRITNLTAAATPAAFAREHIVDCLAVVPHVGTGRVLDVGSGNGLPGIVLAVAVPALAVTLLEPRAKRARFLTQVAIELELANVDIVNAQVERHQPSVPYDVIIARAFGGLSEFVAATRALQRTSTRILAMKARLDRTELAECGVDATALATVALAVPGYAERHLVIINGGSAAAGEPWVDVP